MAVTTELSTLHHRVEELRQIVEVMRARYGDIPPVRRLQGDIDRLSLDAADLDGLAPIAETPRHEMHVIDDTPVDPSLWAGADDEGLGGYHR